MHNLVGNRYHITKKLSQGGFGQTYLAIDTQSPTKANVVVKKLNFDTTSSSFEIIQRKFFEEATALETLSYQVKAIPRFRAYVADETTKEFYLVQDFVDGINLEQYTQNNDWTLGQVLWFLQNSLQILDQISKNNFIHRDIKPSNFMINKGGELFLIDFGAVKQIVANQSSTINQKSVVIGTPGFMSPEHSIGEPSFASDIFSLGMTCLYFFSKENLAPHSLKEAFNKVNSLAPNLDAKLQYIIEKSVKNCESQRYQNAESMLKDLGSLDYNSLDYIDISGEHVVNQKSTYDPESNQFNVPTLIQFSYSSNVAQTEYVDLSQGTTEHSNQTELTLESNNQPFNSNLTREDLDCTQLTNRAKDITGIIEISYPMGWSFDRKSKNRMDQLQNAKACVLIDNEKITENNNLGQSTTIIIAVSEFEFSEIEELYNLEDLVLMNQIENPTYSLFGQKKLHYKGYDLTPLDTDGSMGQCRLFFTHFMSSNQKNYVHITAMHPNHSHNKKEVDNILSTLSFN